MIRVGFAKHNGAGEILFRQGHPANFKASEGWSPVYVLEPTDVKPPEHYENAHYHNVGENP